MDVVSGLPYTGCHFILLHVGMHSVHYGLLKEDIPSRYKLNSRNPWDTECLMQDYMGGGSMD